MIEPDAIQLTAHTRCHIRTYEDRLETISNVRDAGISVCCGGILGLGEVITFIIFRLRARGTETSVLYSTFKRLETSARPSELTIASWERFRGVALALVERLFFFYSSSNPLSQPEIPPDVLVPPV